MWSKVESSQMNMEMGVLSMLTILAGVEIMITRTSCQLRCAVLVEEARQWRKKKRTSKRKMMSKQRMN